MSRRYTYEATVQFGGLKEDREFDVKVSFSVAWGSPECGRFGPPEDYDCGSPDEVEDIRVETIEGKADGWGLAFAGGYMTDAQFAADVIECLDPDELIRVALEDEEARMPDHA